MNMLFWTVIISTYLESLTCEASLSNIIYSVRRPLRTSVLERKHIVATVAEYPIVAQVKMNASGHLIEVRGLGPLIFEWLSTRYKFDYSVLAANVSTMEAVVPNLPGLISYLTRGDCDIILGAISPTSERLKLIDLVHPFLATPVSVLIPAPDILQNNIDAIVKPFQFWVWVGLIVTITTVTITLLVLTSKRILRSNFSKPTQRGVIVYILGTLLNQGGYIPNKTTTIRFVVGSWCLLTLVLLNVYNGTLISYVTETRNEKPLIYSYHDIVTNPHVNLVVVKGTGIDVVVSAAVSSLHKSFADKMRAYPNSRCETAKKCVDLVTSLPARHVYLEALVSLKSSIARDYRETKKCRLTIAGGQPLSVRLVGWGLAKNSPHLEIFNRGTLTLHDNGLIGLWTNQLEPDVRPCYLNKRKALLHTRQSKRPLARLTLENLSGAFAILAIGCLISVSVFGTEIVCRTFNFRYHI